MRVRVRIRILESDPETDPTLARTIKGTQVNLFHDHIGSAFTVITDSNLYVAVFGLDLANGLLDLRFHLFPYELSSGATATNREFLFIVTTSLSPMMRVRRFGSSSERMKPISILTP
jgi:hypothetical protein